MLPRRFRSSSSWVVRTTRKVTARKRLIGDKAYDDDKLDRRVRDSFGVELIAPNRKKRRQTGHRRDRKRPPVRRERRDADLLDPRAKGGRKTYLAGKIVEELHRLGCPVIIIDQVGNWWD